MIIKQPQNGNYNVINQMPGLIKEVKKSVVDYKSELSALRKKTLNINRSVCNLDEVISSIQASSQTQDRKIHIGSSTY